MVDQPAKVSKYKTIGNARKPRVGGVLAARLRAKGWSVRDAADYLGISRQRLYAVFADPNRARLWDCAIAGMPACTAEIAQELKDRRRHKQPPAKIKGKAVEGSDFAIGDGVAAVAYAGIAEEGGEGWISAIRNDQGTLQLQVRMLGGTDWFPRAEFDRLFMTNGKTHPTGVAHDRT